MPSLAKTSPPRLFAVYRRERLFRRLDEARRGPVIWIAGPPGAGKTSLVASYLEARKSCGLWYQVDAGDADPATFFYCLGRAAARAHRGRPLPLLTPECAFDLPGFTRRFFRELGERLPPSSALVFDNVHEGTRRLAAVLRDGLAHLPERISVLLIGREEPGAELARLRATPRLQLVGWEDLRLRPGETASIARLLRPGRRGLRSLHARSAGWVAGLVLLLDEGPRTARRLEIGSREDVFHSLASEILDRMPVETQELLLRTAFLPRLTPGTAEGLSGDPRARRLLEDLHHQNFFTERKASPSVTYEYHGLFREFLLARGRASFSPNEQLRLTREAARLAEARKESESAFHLYHQAGDTDAAHRLVLRQAPVLLAQGRGRTLETWMESLPGGAAAHPERLFWQGLCHLGGAPAEPRRMGPLEDARDLLSLEAGLRTAGRPKHRGRAVPARGPTARRALLS
jgi:ATP/maltotriose-dependent transcriptional regulator MalT